MLPFCVLGPLFGKPVRSLKIPKTSDLRAWRTKCTSIDGGRKA